MGLKQVFLLHFHILLRKKERIRVFLEIPGFSSSQNIELVRLRSMVSSQQADSATRHSHAQHPLPALRHKAQVPREATLGLGEGKRLRGNGRWTAVDPSDVLQLMKEESQPEPGQH